MEENKQSVEAPAEKAKSTEKKEKSAIREIIEAVIIALVITFVIRSFVVDIFRLVVL